MPASSEHAARILDGMRFIGAEYAAAHPNELVVAHFYICLHMLEATLYETHPKYCPEKHFYSHGDRTRFFKSLFLNFNNPLLLVSVDYEALRGLSEQARYLSPAGITAYTPLKVPRDVDQARMCYESIRSKLEALLAREKKTIPWSSKPAPKL
jgi:hypothetical protein